MNKMKAFYRLYLIIIIFVAQQFTSLLNAQESGEAYEYYTPIIDFSDSIFVHKIDSVIGVLKKTKGNIIGKKPSCEIYCRNIRQIANDSIYYIIWNIGRACCDEYTYVNDGLLGSEQWQRCKIKGYYLHDNFSIAWYGDLLPQMKLTQRKQKLIGNLYLSTNNEGVVIICGSELIYHLFYNTNLKDINVFYINPYGME